MSMSKITPILGLWPSHGLDPLTSGQLEAPRAQGAPKPGHFWGHFGPDLTWAMSDLRSQI